MPTDKECTDWNKEVAGQWFGYEELSESLKEKWSNKADRMGFYDWLRRDEGKDRLGALVSLQALKDAISNTNSNDMSSRKRLWDFLAHWPVPCLFAGKDPRGNVYRINPDGGRLRPDSNSYPNDSIGYGILGINFPESSSSSGSDDSSGPADMQPGVFIFHEIGNLEIWCCDPEGFKDDDGVDPEKYSEGGWLATPYYAVLQFFREDEYGRRGGIKTDIADLDIRQEHSMIKGSRGRFLTVAKIADKVEELKFTHKFNLTEAFYDSFTLVMVPETGGSPWYR
ncbi:MAG: hypothetical protein M1813_009247 [Trichoglossum hirsutum]|nr:MAG: hypothetical protein M1813_009247 [Trichoglossum hirsutum]